MAEQSLDKIINWLKNDPLNRWEVYDVNKDEVLEKCLSFQDLNTRYTAPMDYFKELLSRGVTNVQLQRKRKNGSSYRKEGCGLNFALSQPEKRNVDASGSTVRPAATHQQSQMFPGLGNPASGLSFSETIETFTRAKQHDELVARNSLLETEVKQLKDERDKFKEQVLRNELESNNKPSSFDKLLDKLADKPDIIPMILQQFSRPGGQSQGLNAPQQPKLSDNKQYLIDLIGRAQVPDDLSNAASHVIAQGLAENKAFMDQYINLLKEHQLI